MQFNFDVDFILFGYMFICLLLIIFNASYLFYAWNLKMTLLKNTRRWKKSIAKRMKQLDQEGKIRVNHTKHLEKALRNINELMAYARALDKLRKEKVDVQNYLDACYMSYQNLAFHYMGKDHMDKAFFANFIAENTPDVGFEYRPIMEILQRYLEDSTVFCRENVLKAMYSLGNIQAVLNVLEYIEENNIFHHHKLIADGLMSFKGDKEAMAWALWENRSKWGEATMLAVVQFITASLGDFKEHFYEELQKDEISIEVKLAFLRYYQRHRYEPIREHLYRYVRGVDCNEVNMAIVAASVLKNYPGEDTIQVLKEALRDTNWYVRYNAASSLVELSQGENILKEVLNGDDKYAKEILLYKLNELGKEENK